MCDFISWKEVNGKILFLTDKEVFSSKGIEMSQNARHNDFIGHGAINEYFGINRGMGTERELRNFWDTDKLPKEIAEKLFISPVTVRDHLTSIYRKVNVNNRTQLAGIFNSKV